MQESWPPGWHFGYVPGLQGGGRVAFWVRTHPTPQNWTDQIPNSTSRQLSFINVTPIPYLVSIWVTNTITTYFEEHKQCQCKVLLPTSRSFLLSAIVLCCPIVQNWLVVEGWIPPVAFRAPEPLPQLYPRASNAITLQPVRPPLHVLFVDLPRQEEGDDVDDNEKTISNIWISHKHNLSLNLISFICMIFQTLKSTWKSL